jgi:putative oxygen-independent coproporphyrinogen III oxidase
MVPLIPEQIPLSLYVHIPWCVRKCPYCDFNSHVKRTELDEGAYIHALMDDLTKDQEWIGARGIQSVFIGGGTPSLFSAKSIGDLLNRINQQINFHQDVEITLEANPGAADFQRFAGYQAAGVNRLSIGVQSLQDDKLEALGRIHRGTEALAAVRAAQSAGYENYNLDLMYGLPGQTLSEAMQDLQALLRLEPPHLSWYQLTLEPNTLFYQQPPTVPQDDALADMMQTGLERIRRQGYVQYEISAYSQPNKQCRHNLNYWRFGDYLGIGAGAHSKLTLADGQVIRRSKQRHPDRYMSMTDKVCTQKRLMPDDLVLEFMLNVMRLHEGVSIETFYRRTGISIADMEPQLDEAIGLGLMQVVDGALRSTKKGRLYLNNLLAIFMD